MAGLTYPMMLGLAVLVLPAVYLMYKGSERFSKAVALSRALIVLLLVGAAAQPYVNAQEEISQTPEVTILQDKSSSTQLLQKEDLEFEEVKVRERTIASGNSSDLRNGLLRNLEENTNYLVVSDFQSSSSLGDIAERFREKNSTLNTIEYETQDEAAVSIQGPTTTVPGAETQFIIKVSSTSEIPSPTVTIDGSEVTPVKISNNTWRVSETFDSQGSHTVKASLDVQDRFQNNNEYYHAVDVTEKPEVLVIGQQGALGDKISKFYDITYEDSVPEDLSPYYTVIATEEVDAEPLIPYITEGNGFVYTGDIPENSYDVLPVRRGDPSSLTDATKTVLAIDNSRELGGEEEDARTRSIRMSKAVINGLQTNNRVGMVYYNGTSSFEPTAGILSSPIPLSRNRQKLKDKIAGLQPGGPAFHNAGLKAAKQIVNGTGNIILLTDGYLAPGASDRPFRSSAGYQIQQDSYRIVEGMEENLIVIKVGEPGGDKQNKERAENFLKQLESKSGGDYYQAGRILQGDGTTINLLGGGGTQGQKTPVSVVRDDHFITERIDMDTSVIDVDPAETKRGSTELARVSNGNPFLTVWRYGIGRVAAYTADGSQLENTVESDPLLVSRSVSWTVGDPKRKQDDWIRINSARRPDNVEIRSSNEIEGFKRQRENLYVREFKPNSTGFGTVEGKYYSYNYPEEFQNVGYSEEMQGIATSTGGEVYQPGEKEQMVEDIKNFSENKTVRQQQLGSYFIAAALLIFLAEIGYRKVNGKK